MRRRRRNANLAWLAREVFFTMFGVLMSIGLVLVMSPSTATSTPLLAPTAGSPP